MKCPSCGRAKPVRDERNIPHTFKGRTATMRAVRGDFCPNCGEIVLDAAESSRIGAAMRKFDKQVNATLARPE